MKFEYTDKNIHLKILDENNTKEVLKFYHENKDIFDVYEPDKPDTFYTPDFISNLLNTEYNLAIHNKHIRFFFYDTSVTDEIIGTVSFSNILNGAFHSCTIGYKIAKKYQRHGYAKKMLTMAINIMVNDLKMHRIEAYISLDNVASLAVVNSLGFINEGIAHSYAYLKGTWTDHMRFVYIS